MQTEFIKTQNLLPGVYCSESRDFQLFCRALDVIVNAVKYDADSIPQLNSTDDIRENMLDLLQTKLGFVPSQTYSTDKLRIILSVIPLLRRYKGCRQGIEYALNAYSKIYQLKIPVVFRVVQIEPVYLSSLSEDACLRVLDNLSAILHLNEATSVEVPQGDSDEETESDTSTELAGIKTVNILRIGLSDASVDILLLDDLLHYVLPFGFVIQYVDYRSIDTAH